MLFAILLGIRHILDGSPLLQAHIQDRHQFARQQLAGSFAELPQEGQFASHRIEHRLV